MSSFFKWLEENSPGFTKRIFDNFSAAIEGSITNPIQWKATEKALDTEFSKATQTIEQHNTGDVRYVITRDPGEPVPSPREPGENPGGPAPI